MCVEMAGSALRKNPSSEVWSAIERYLASEIFDHADGLDRIVRWRDRDWIQGGKPAYSPSNVDIRVPWFPTMSFVEDGGDGSILEDLDP